MMPQILKSLQLSLSRYGLRKNLQLRQRSTHFRSGAVKPKPQEMPFGLVAVICAIIPGLFVGAQISKSIANFFEENDLFIPWDDDDYED